MERISQEWKGNVTSKERREAERKEEGEEKEV